MTIIRHPDGHLTIDGKPVPEPAGHSNRGYDAGALAFYVRDLMDAAGYVYDPRRPLHEQVAECCEKIRIRGIEKSRAAAEVLRLTADHAAEVQRLTDLVDELRKHVDAQTRRAERAEENEQATYKRYLEATGAMP